MKRNLVIRGLLCVASCLAIGSASAGAIWTDWTAISGSAATGDMGGVSVSVVANGGSMNGPSQTGCGPGTTNWWTEPNPSNRPYTGGSLGNGPIACEQVALSSRVDVTVTFGSAVSDLYMALLSVGQSGTTVTYDFDRAFTIDSQGQGFWGSGPAVPGVGDTLAMTEFHGLLHFTSPVTSLRFTTNRDEYWHAFTFATTTVPEPGTLALVGVALLAGAARKRRGQAV